MTASCASRANITNRRGAIFLSATFAPAGRDRSQTTMALLLPRGVSQWHQIVITPKRRPSSGAGHLLSTRPCQRHSARTTRPPRYPMRNHAFVGASTVKTISKCKAAIISMALAEMENSASCGSLEHVSAKQIRKVPSNQGVLRGLFEAESSRIEARVRNGLTSDIALLDLAGAGGIEPPSMESKIRDLRARWD
jgi:hypothetical protein